MFVDEARIFVEGGRGGDGCASFLREKYRPHGGPDGGSGGRGGDVVIEVTGGMRTLGEFARRKHFRAGAGARGGSKDRRGARGKDLVVTVPPGTVVRDEDGKVVADMVSAGQRFVAADGGRGGRGNASLVVEAGPVPRFAEKGEPGRSGTLSLELKLVADVAIVGFPNAGKSSLISRISRAKPKVADYPFTTLEPHLGVVVRDDVDVVVADVPGLVEGAHEGRGMGTSFLRHIERSSVILFLVDMSPASGRRPVDDLVVLSGELAGFKPELSSRKALVAANKMDLNPPREAVEELGAECSLRGLELFEISAVTGIGLEGLTGAMAQAVREAREAGSRTGEHVSFDRIFAEERMVVSEKDGAFVVTGRNVERLVMMTDWENEDARSHLAAKLKDAGVEEALTRAGATTGRQIEIAGREFEFVPEGEAPLEAGDTGAGDDG